MGRFHGVIIQLRLKAEISLRSWTWMYKGNAVELNPKNHCWTKKIKLQNNTEDVMRLANLDGYVVQIVLIIKHINYQFDQ